MKHIIMTLVLVLSSICMADEPIDDKQIRVDGTIAKTIYKNLENFTEKQCDEKQCSIYLDSISCIGIAGFYTCDLGVIQNDKYTLTFLLGTNANKLYQNLKNINKSFCDNEYVDFCINDLRNVKCSCSGSFFNKRYVCEVGI